MLNEFGSYADTLDNTKSDLNRKNLSTERNNYCTGNVSDIGSRSANLPVPAATWNCNPYLGNFYNYYGNNSYDTSDVHQYDNQKCVNQFSRNYPQHTIQSASVLQCCDPRCQLFSDHSKYPFSNTLANKYNNQRPKTKNCYDVEPSKCDKGIERAKYPAFAYPPMQSNMSKYNGQQSNYNALYQNSVKSKHMILPPPPPPPPTETSSLGDYYTDIGKPSYWNKQTFWNRGIPNSYYQQPPPPPAPTFDHDKMQKIGHEQNNVNQRGILFNRLLDHRKVYDPSYLPNYHYARPPLTLPNKNTSYYQSYPEREFANCDGPRAQNSYQTLPFNVHYVDPTNTHKEKDAKAEEKRLLDKNPNLDVREFLSTWDDVEDDKVAEPEPVIVLDCTSLETEALAKVKEKLDVSFEPSNTVLKVIHDEISPHTSVIQESAERHEKERHDKDAEGYWYGQKKKDDLSYDLVEMTERLVNTVDKLFGDEKSEKEIYEAKEAEKNEDEWNINFNYKRKPPPPEPRYKPKEDLVPYKSYQDEAEKNVSCSFNLQKTTNDLKFSVNYSKQTESYAAKVQDYSVKCKTTEKEKCKRVEDYAYKNYYNSFYYNNPNCEYMQMENVKECAYDVENIDKEICNDASDITLVKADLEKSLKEITHRFSYQKKIESTEKELPKEKSSYDYQQNYLERDLELPKLDEVHDKHESATSVIQKTSSCVENNVYDERDELCNENSMLSMPSLSPPPANQENRISSVGLTLNDVYDDEVIFDALHKPQEDKEGLNFLNIVKNDDKRESVVYPLNLAITKEKDLGSSNLQEAKDDNVSKVDDGYYSVENHFDRDNKNEYDNQDGDEARMDEGKKPIYKTCIVAREQYEPCFQDASRDCDNLIERNNQIRVPSPILNLVKEPVIVETDPRDVDGFADSNKLHSSSTDDEKLLKSSKFKKYKKHKKMKNQLSSVIKENGHFNFHKMFPNIQACVEEAQKNEETIKESHPSGKSPTKNGHNGSLPILVAENETDDLEGECNLKKRKFCFVKDADLPVKKRKQGMAGMESFTDVDRSHETKMESAPCMVTGVLEGSEYSLNGKYQMDTKEDLSEHKISTADDVCRQKSKKKHKKDKDRVKIKSKKQKKKEKIHEQRKAHNDDTKSPERAMLDGLNDACKFPTSVAELRGTRMHAIYQNGDDFGAETVNDDHLDNEPIAGSLGEEMRSRVETAMETEINPICVNSNDELAYSSKRDLDGHETRSRETTEKHALSDGENYTSRRKKFKYNALSDDERWQSFRSTFKLSSDKPHSVVIESQYEGVLDQPSEHESNDVTIYETDIQTEDVPCPCQIPESIPPDSNVSPLNESAYSVPSPESPGTPPEPLEMPSESMKTPPESTEMPPESPTTPEPSETPLESPDILPHSPETPLEPSETPPESPGILPQSPETPLEPSETPPESPGVLPQSPGTPLEPSETPPESPRMPQSPGTPLEPSETPPESPEIPPELPRTPPEPSETSTESPEIPPEPPRSPPVHPETPPELSVTLPQSPKPHLQSPKTPPEPSEASPRDFINPPIIPDPVPSFESTADELLRSPEPNDLSSAGVNHKPDVSDLQRVPQPDSPVGNDLQKDVPNLSHVDTNVLEDAEVEPVDVVENDVNEVILTSSSKDPSPRRTSTGHLEAESGDKWSGENSPRVDNFINKEWPVDAVPEVETREQEWRENSSFLDDNIDHEEAISDVPGQDRCIWSNENSPDVSDEEDCVAFAEYKDTSNWSRDISPCPSETTPKKSISSDSDSEDEDCSKTPRSKASLSDDESDKRSPKKSYDSSDAESNHACDKDSDESSNCDETPKIDDFFNIPSVAPTPHCDLNKEEDDCKFDESSKLDIHSKAPSPNCNFHEEAPSPFCILNEVTDEPKPSYYDHSNVSSVAPSPKCDIIDGAIDDVKGQEDIPSQEIPPEVPSLRELAAGALAKLTFSSVPSFSNLLEVWVTPERTEIIIHSEDNEPSKTDLVINDNQVMITDAYDDDDVNMATNFDQIKEIAFDYSMGLDAVSDDKPDDDVQCQCLIISSEESVVCLRCSLNSSIIVNQDLDGANFDDKVDHIVYENEITPDSCDISYIPTNCIEDSFIDQKLNVTPDHVEEVITESIPIPNQTQEDQEADNEVENITVSAPLAEHHSRNVQLKVQLPWHKIFNLNQDKSQDHKVLELGPAKIQLRLSSDDNGNLPKSIEERASPVVKVKRLVLQRAVDVVEQRTPSPVNQSDTKEVVSRLPKMVIKKTSCKEYKSFLQHNTLQPVVKLYKYKGLDELARKMTQVNNYSVNLKELKLFSIPDHVIDSTPRVVSVHQDTDLGHPASQEDSGDEPDTILEPISDTSTKRDLASIPESHHCLLCHRSFPSEESYRIHIKSRYHRHLELTQRKTIHAMYRHFTGHICPRLRPLSVKERKKMKWKPRSANVNHFYHEKTPLQIALHKSVFENKPKAKCS